MSDEKLQEIVTEYADLAKDKNIDVATLMINALQQEDANKISSRTKKWAYILSLSLPPIGLAFALWFWMGDKTDKKNAAYICIALTAVTIIATIIFFNVILSSSGTSIDQINQIKPADIYQLSQ